MHSRPELAEAFTALGVAPGDTVMVHASVRAVGPIAGGPDQVHLAIKDALTDRGTMLMYAGCPDGYDDVGRGVYPGSHELELLDKMPAFDARTARAARDHALDGKILLIGCDHDQVTFLHYAEHIVNVPGSRIATFEVPVLDNGVRVWKEMKEIDTSGAGAHPNWPDRFFAQIVNAYLATTQNRGARVGHAHCFLFDAKGLLVLALDEMRAAAGGK